MLSLRRRGAVAVALAVVAGPLIPTPVAAAPAAVVPAAVPLAEPTPEGGDDHAGHGHDEGDAAVPASADLEQMWSSGWMFASDPTDGAAPGDGGIGLPAAVGVTHSGGAWVTPTMPPKCSDAQKASGNVAGCLLDGPTGLPETFGWPTPPFPEAVRGDVIAWVDLGVGAKGLIVSDVQKALVAAGASIVVDGDFGSQTAAAVKVFQRGRGLPETGVVDAATANALGVQNYALTFPPPGWNWLGWGYNGSPALAGWESQLVHNAASITGAAGTGTVRAGAIRSMPEVLPLYEGFLREVMAGGYAIREAGSYVFRCTSNAGKPCNGLGRAALSNHAYGLAMDINTVANPERTYTGVNGASACSTPMATDMPQWVVQVAERWGLYWGGYGWSGGCATPTQVKSSILRDPMHFEFRGTPQQALAIVARNSTGPKYCANVASNAGTVSVQCTPGTMPAGGWRLQVPTGVPAGASAALVNITANEAAGEGYLTAESCGATPGGIRAWSNGNFATGETTANVAVVPVDAEGRFCIYISTAVHVVVDVQGYLVPPDKAGGQGRLFTVVGPQRVVDTRTLGYCTPSGACTRAAPVPSGTHALVQPPPLPPNASAVLANLTVTGPRASGYLTADRCSSLAPGEQTRSNVNFVANQTVANLAMVPVEAASPTSFCTYASAPTHNIVDVLGVFVPPASGGWAYTSLPQKRLADTRICYAEPGGQQVCGARRPAGSILRIQGPAGASAAVVNLTLAEASSTGYATAGRCSTMTGGMQPYSNINVLPGDTAANLAVVPLDGDGQFCVYSSVATHVIVDLQGSFSAGGGQQFVSLTPQRTMDTRSGGVPPPS